MSLRFRALALSLALLAQLVFGITPLLAQEGGRATTADREPGQTAKDEGGVEVITVTARRKEENIQDIPIAVSAFSADDLATSNIDDVADVQFNVPNLTYTKTNFSGAGNIAIRGVGNLATAATAENGTGIHINDAPFPGSRIYETEFYDVGSVQVLRGPQGTLFGRSSPGGAVNVYTKKPVMEEWGGYGALEYGEYNHVKVRGALNIPIGEHLAARVAGFYFRRDGITDVKNGKFGCVGVSANCPKDDEIDGRNVYAFRASLHGEWDDANFDLMGQYFRADDDRMRINNQGCVSDNTAWPNGIGCLGGNNKTKPGGVNYNSTLGFSSGIYIDTLYGIGAAPSRFLAGPQAVMTPLLFTNALAPPGGLPAGLVNATFGYFQANPCTLTPGTNSGACPGYLLNDAAGDAIFGPGTYGMPTEFYAGTNRPSDLRSINTQMNPRYGADEIQITFTANFDLTENLSLTSVTGWHRAWVNSMTDYWWGTPDNGFGANRTYDFPDSNLGGQYGSEFVFDKSKSVDTMFTEELRLVSSFDGIFNFQFGAIYNDAKVYAIYDVWATSLESFWKAVGAYPFQPDTSYYKNETRPSTLQSYAIFG
jgi:outer membrane receptor protein involved in Fe transport